MKKKSSLRRPAIIFRPATSVWRIGQLFKEEEELAAERAAEEPSKGDKLIDYGAAAQRVHVAKMTAKSGSFGTDLLHLFNVKLVEHVRQTGPHTYVPVFVPKLATHQLVGTLWRRDKDRQEIVEHGYAVAVVAKPLRPRLRQTQLVIKQVIPDTAPAYRTDGPLMGKRGVLSWIVLASMHKTRQRGMLRAITKMDDADCDLTYMRLRRASLILKFK